MTKEFAASLITTPLGKMLAVADSDALYALEFSPDIEQAKNRIAKRLNGSIAFMSAPPLESIECELGAYFAGTLKSFETPLGYVGSEFQRDVWQALKSVPFGETRSYRDQAIAIGRSTSFRAVANANGQNPLCIVLPCHRIIQSDGRLGGYSGGIEKKIWLLAHEDAPLKLFKQ